MLTHLFDSQEDSMMQCTHSPKMTVFDYLKKSCLGGVLMSHNFVVSQ